MKGIKFYIVKFHNKREAKNELFNNKTNMYVNLSGKRVLKRIYIINAQKCSWQSVIFLKMSLIALHATAPNQLKLFVRSGSPFLFLKMYLFLYHYILFICICIYLLQFFSVVRAYHIPLLRNILRRATTNCYYRLLQLQVNINIKITEKITVKRAQCLICTFFF